MGPHPQAVVAEQQAKGAAAQQATSVHNSSSHDSAATRHVTVSEGRVPAAHCPQQAGIELPELPPAKRARTDAGPLGLQQEQHDSSPGPASRAAAGSCAAAAAAYTSAPPGSASKATPGKPPSPPSPPPSPPTQQDHHPRGDTPQDAAQAGASPEQQQKHAQASAAAQSSPPPPPLPPARALLPLPAPEPSSAPPRRYFPNKAKARLRRRASTSPAITPPQLPQEPLSSTAHPYWADLAAWLARCHSPLADHLEAAEQAFLLAALPAHLAAVPLDLVLVLAKVLASTAAATSLRCMAARCAHNVLHLLARQRKARVAAARQAEQEQEEEEEEGQQQGAGARRRSWRSLTVCCAPPGVTLVRLLCCPQLLSSLLAVTGSKEDVDEELASCCAKMLNDEYGELQEEEEGQQEGSGAMSASSAAAANRLAISSNKEWRLALKAVLKDAAPRGDITFAFLLRLARSLLQDEASASELLNTPRQYLMWLLCCSKASERQTAVAKRWGVRAAHSLIQHSGFQAVMPVDLPVAWRGKGNAGAHVAPLAALAELVHGLVARHARASSAMDMRVLEEALVLAGALALFVAAQLRLRRSAREEPRLLALVSHEDVSILELAREVVAGARARGQAGVLHKAKGLYQACKDVEELLLPEQEEEEEQQEEEEEL